MAEVRAQEYRLNAVGRDADGIVNSPSSRPPAESGARYAGPKLSGELLDRTEYRGVNGGGAAVGPRVSSAVTLTVGSAASSSSFARTLSTSTPGTCGN